MKNLTKRQKEVLDFIQKFIQNHRYSPSYREIMRHFRLSSLGSVAKHVYALKRKGVLRGEKQCHRSLMPQKILPEDNSGGEMTLPFIGHLSAGAPIKMFPQTQKILVPGFLVRKPEDTYVLKAFGHSLVEEYIIDGDILMIEARDEAKAGEVVVGHLHANDTIVKKYYPVGNSVRLTSKTPQSEPLFVAHEDFCIIGVMVAVLRQFSHSISSSSSHS